MPPKESNGTESGFGNRDSDDSIPEVLDMDEVARIKKKVKGTEAVADKVRQSCPQTGNQKLTVGLTECEEENGREGTARG